MSKFNTCRWCGMACILSGLLLPISWIMEVVLDYPPSLVTMSLNFAAITLIIFALSGIFAFQSEQIGISGFLGYLLTILMSCLGLSLIGWSPESEPTAAADALVMLMGVAGLAGYTLLAIGSWKANLLPRWAVLLWPVGTVISAFGGILEFANADYLHVIGISIWGIGMIAVGIKLLPGTIEPAAQPAAAA